jgi:hypothetical protein
MTESTQAQQLPQPDAQLKALDRLVGSWRVSGGTTGTVTYRWMDGGFFLLQDIEMKDGDGQSIKGLEVIGRLRTFGAEQPSEDIKSRYYDTEGNTLDYVYELEGDTLTIWGMEKGSPAYYKGTFSEDGNTVTGAWHYPGGGGYDSMMTRIA